jgi:ubiquinone/menaquinone biosynthesis C-methylase UbiE
MRKFPPALLTVPELRDVYSRLAPLYGLLEILPEGAARREARALARVADGERVLEIGVGPGWDFEKLSSENPSGITAGLDLTQGMLERAKRRCRRRSLASPTLLQADCRSLPFRSGSFDVVYSAYVFDALATQDTETTLLEIRRVLKPSGRLVLLHMSASSPWFNLFWRMLYWIVPNLLGGCRPIEIAEELAQAGFTVSEVRRLRNWGIPTGIILSVAATEQISGAEV